MISTRFCPNCGAANDKMQTRCFACDQLLPTDDDDEPVQQAALLQGRYRLGALLGSGGYSAVYRGRDTRDGEREVAIKQIALRGLSTEQTIEATNTFHREIQALCTLSHPQVPHLLDHFSDQGHWYLVLDFIQGVTLEEYLRQRQAQHKPLHLEEILAMALHLCRVLEYLHSRHPPLIFRDLKPDNIMRTPGGKLCLIDFGIARRFTPGQPRDTQRLGSPGYAAPEQYGRAQTDARADVYSLGALLHHLLSGQDPSEHPRGLPPLRLQGEVSNPDLEKLVERMLALEPRDRPASMREISGELERIKQQLSAYQSGRIWLPPIPLDYPTSGAPQVQLQILGQSKGPTPPLATPAVQPRRKSLTRRRVLVGMGIGGLVLTGGIRVALSTPIAPPALPLTHSHTLHTYAGHFDGVYSLAWSPDGNQIASSSADNTVHIWDALSGGNVSIYGYSNAANCLAWSSDGIFIAAGFADGEVQVWTPYESGNLQMPGQGKAVNGLAWSPISGSRILASASSDTTVVIQNTEQAGITVLEHQAGAINSVTWSPDDGWYLASAADDHTVVVWDTNTHQVAYPIYAGHTNAVTSVVWLPNSVYIASGSLDRTARIWDPTTGATLITYQEHMAAVQAIASSPDNSLIASGSADGTVRIWSTFDGNTRMVYTGHTNIVTSVAWSPDGKYIASGSTDKTVRVWEAPSPSS